MHIWIIGLIVRLALSVLFVGIKNHDTIGWETIGALTLKGVSVYPSHAHEYHAFFPLFLYIDALGLWMQQFKVPYMLVVKVICSLFDAANIFLVYLLSGKNKTKTWIYALNPISIMVTSIHGQFEAIPVFFLLLSVFLAKKGKSIFAGLAGSFAVAFKTWPVMFLIPLSKRMKSPWYSLIYVIVPMAAILFYMYIFHAKLWDIIHETLFYRGQTGNYGVGYILAFFFDMPQSMLKIVSNLFLVSFLVFSIFNIRKTILDEMLDLFLFFFIFSPTFGLQWLAWITPFIIIRLPRYSLLFLLLTSLYMFIPNYYWSSQNEQVMSFLNPLGLLSWGSLIMVAIVRVRPLVVSHLDAVYNRNKHNEHKSNKKRISKKA